MKIKLEKFNREDFPYYFQLVNNEKVMKMITGTAIALEAARADFEQLVENNQLDPCYGNFKILLDKTNEFVGLGKLEIKDEHSEEAELGYIVLPEHWGKKIGSEVAKHLIGIGRSKGALKRLFAIIDPANLPSRKILINNGFVSKQFKDFDGLPGEILELSLR